MLSDLTSTAVRCSILRAMTHVKGAAHQRSMENASIAMMPQHGHPSLIIAFSPMLIMEQSFFNGGIACLSVPQTIRTLESLQCPSLHRSQYQSLKAGMLLDNAADLHRQGCRYVDTSDGNCLLVSVSCAQKRATTPLRMAESQCANNAPTGQTEHLRDFVCCWCALGTSTTTR